MEMKDFVISFLVIGLFIIAIIAFGINLGEENSSSISIENDSRISNLYSGVNDTFYNYDGDGTTIQGEANESYGAITSENPVTEAISDIFFASIGFVAKSISGVSYALFGSIFDPLLKIIIPQDEPRRIVLMVLSSLLLTVFALLIWKLYRTGS